jgi:hypothetical protein
MGKIFTGDGWLIKVHGDEHPPVHAHVLHPDGKASIDLDGMVQNAGVPAKIIALATDWLTNHKALVEAEWAKMNNPRKR